MKTTTPTKGLQIGDINPNLDRETIANNAQKLVPTSTPIILKPEQSSGGTNLKLPQPSTDTISADVAVAGAKTTSTALDGYLKKLEAPETELSKQDKALTDRLSELYGQNVGRADATLKAEKQVGLDKQKKALADINNNILVKNAQYEKLQTDIEGKPIAMQFITGQQAQSRRQQASDIGLLQARALGMQGQIQASQEAVTRAIDLQFKGREEEIQAKEKQLALIQPLLNAEQAKIATAQQLMLQDEKDKIAEQKATQKDNVNYAVEMGIDTQFYTRGGTVIRTSDGYAFSTPEEAFKAGVKQDFSNAPRVATQDTMFAIPSLEELGGAQFYKYPNTSKVYSNTGMELDLATFKRLTNQEGVADDKVNFSGIKTLTPPSTNEGSSSTGGKFTSQSGMRTDRHNNPIAAAVTQGGTNQFTKALDSAGIKWSYGDPFPGNPSMVSIRIEGDGVEGARAILSNSNALQGWYLNHTGKAVLNQYGIFNNTQFAKAPESVQNAIIKGIYQAEGGNGSLTGGATTTPAPTPTPTDKWTVDSATSAIKDGWTSEGYIQGNGKISSKDFKEARDWWTKETGFASSTFNSKFDSLIDKSGDNWRSDYGL